MNQSTHFHYRPEIDGLRALAVLAVVLFHMGLGCRGGFVGVDVFFVISGFLITSLICRDLENGTFSFVTFWERRARRIAPALVVMTLVTVAAGYFILLPDDFKKLGASAAAQTVFAANIYFWKNTGYFDGEADQMPLLHTWSLAVEEQFYLITPFILWGAYRLGMFRNRRHVLALLLTGFVISFAASVYGLMTNRASGTFYLLPTRAWELLLGSILAVMPASAMFSRKSLLRELLAGLGIALIISPVIVYRISTPFPGLAALPPCLGTGLVIWTGGDTWIGRLLSTRPFVFIGLISYSLYLWHWPIAAYNNYMPVTPLTTAGRVGMFAFSIVCGILSWKYIETPFRIKSLGASRKAIFSYAGFGLAAVLGVGITLNLMDGFPRRFTEQSLKFAGAKFDRVSVDKVSKQDALKGDFVHLGADGSSNPPSVFIWGDSHAESALPAIEKFLIEQGVVGQAYVRPAMVPIINWHIPMMLQLNEKPLENKEAVLAHLQKTKVPHVVLIARWPFYVSQQHQADTLGMKQLAPALLETVEKLVEMGCCPWVMLSVPEHEFDVPHALARYHRDSSYLNSICAKPGGKNELSQELLKQIEAAGGRVIDPKPKFLDPTGAHYMIQSDGQSLYYDDDHLSATGAELMLLPFFRDALMLKNSDVERISAAEVTIE